MYCFCGLFSGKAAFLGCAVIPLESVAASFEQRVQNLDCSREGGFSYDLIVTVVETHQEVTQHQGV